MNWDGAIITDSGGFQVFSLAHGNVADEIKGRRGSAGNHGAILDIAEEGVRFRSYLDGVERFMGPEESMGIQAALGSDIALVFDECTPYHADLDYTARSTERTHRWLDRCLTWHEREGPEDQAVFGIVQGGVHQELRRSSAERVSAAAIDGISIGGTLGRDKDEMAGVLELTVPLLPADAPKHLLGIGEPDDLLNFIALGIDVFDCAGPDSPGQARGGAGAAARRSLPDERALARAGRRRGAARRGMPVSGLRATHARLPPLPGPRGGADGGPASHAAQPDAISSAWCAAHARRSRRAATRSTGGRPGRRPPWDA